MIDGMRAWHVLSWYICPPDLSSVPFLRALGSIGWHRVALSIPNASRVARGCWCQGVCSIRAVQSPPARHRAWGIRRLLQGLWGFAGRGEIGLFQGVVVRAGFMK